VVAPTNDPNSDDYDDDLGNRMPVTPSLRMIPTPLDTEASFEPSVEPSVENNMVLFVSSNPAFALQHPSCGF
jgi:hypothetical protein